MRAESVHDDWKRVGPDFRQVGLAWCARREGQLLDWWGELRGDVGAIASWIDPVPSDGGQPDGIQSVQTIRRAAAIDAEALITESSGQSVGSQQRSQQVTLRVTVSASLAQYL
jgi:hypothetical protein